MSSEKRKIAYIDGKPYEIGANHTSILKFVKSYVGEKKVPTLCDDPNLAPYGACRVCSVEVALEKDGRLFPMLPQQNKLYMHHKVLNLDHHKELEPFFLQHNF